MDANPLLHALNDISDRLSRIEWMMHGASAVYVGNGRVMTRITVGSTHLIYFVKSDDRLFVPWLIAHGVFEPEVTNFFANHIKSEYNCLDVGANFGYYSCLMGRLALKGKTIAIEPDPQIFEILRDNIHINWLEATVVPIHAAVADTSRPLTLYRRLTRSGNTSIVNVPPQELAIHGEAPSEPFEIMATPLDDLIPVFGGRLDALKVDVEGAEPLVFRGAKELIAANPDLKIVMEWSPGQIQTAGFDIGEFTRELAAMGLEPAIIQSAGTEGISWQSLLDGPYRSGVLLTRSDALPLRSVTSEGVIQNAGLDSPTERQPRMEGPSYHFTANDLRLRTEIGIRENHSIRVTEAQRGIILYGPYINLPPGSYEALIRFNPDAPCHGSAILDVCSDAGVNVLVKRIVTAEEIFEHGMTAGIQFLCPNRLLKVEVRLMCDNDFAATIQSVEISEEATPSHCCLPREPGRG
jgi:FkbM family methyltransferase